MTALQSRNVLLASTAIPRRRKAYSMIRFSHPSQALGDSARRQLDNTIAYCAAHDLELAETFRDEGKSGLHGFHRKKGAFGRFVRRFLRGELDADSVFICEGFDRFTREPVRIAQQLFLSLINGDPERGIGGLTVVTLIDNKTYSAESIDDNVGELYTSIALMLGAHMESANKGKRIGETWNAPHGRRNGGIGKETGLPSNIFPAWINKTKDGPKLDKRKQKILHRIRKLIETMGCEAIAKTFNDEEVPPLNSRKRPGRDVPLWDKTTIGKIIRGRQVLGEQAIGRYQDVKDPDTGEVTFKRVLTGEVRIDAYPAAWSEDQWRVANHHLERRRRGAQMGRNTVAYPNLFTSIARCAACQGRMKVRGKGRLGPFKYLGCSNAGLKTKGKGGCTNSQYYRLDKLEAAVLPHIAHAVIEDTSEIDPTESLIRQIATAKTEAGQIEQEYLRSMKRTGPLAELAQTKLERDYQIKRDEVATAEREFAAHQAAKPTGELQQTVRTVLDKALAGDVKARAKVAEALPGLVTLLRFELDSTVTAGIGDREYRKLLKLDLATGRSLYDKPTGP